MPSGSCFPRRKSQSPCPLLLGEGAAAAAGVEGTPEICGSFFESPLLIGENEHNPPFPYSRERGDCYLLLISITLSRWMSWGVRFTWEMLLSRSLMSWASRSTAVEPMDRGL